MCWYPHHISCQNRTDWFSGCTVWIVPKIYPTALVFAELTLILALLHFQNSCLIKSTPVTLTSSGCWLLSMTQQSFKKKKKNRTFHSFILMQFFIKNHHERRCFVYSYCPLMNSCRGSVCLRLHVSSNAHQFVYSMYDIVTMVKNGPFHLNLQTRKGCCFLFTLKQ